MATYNRYPAMDKDNNFPPPVRTAIANSTEMINTFFRRGEVSPMVSEALRSNPTITSAATTAVSDAIDGQLLEEGIVSGRAIAENGGNTDLSTIGYRHTDDNGNFLPLGYTTEGRLDDHAIRIWSEDLDVGVTVDDHPEYAHLIVTEENHLLLGIRWDGGVDIPGGNIGGSIQPTNPETATKIPLYQDAPWKPGSDILPAFASTKSWSGWGSSSMEGMNSNMRARSGELGVPDYYNGAKGGERSDHIAARLGSVPALLNFPSNIVPASGAVLVSSSNLSISASLRSYTGWVTSMEGEKVHGTLSSTSSAITFTRTEAGNSIPVKPSTPFIPEIGPQHRGDTAFLWMGKNNITQVDRVISDTDKSYEYFVPLVKRVIVLGHFMNTGQAATNNNTRTSLLKINQAHAERYGDCYFEVNDYLTSNQLWIDTGIKPTDIDLAEQAMGNKPPSVSSDAGHLNGAGYLAVSNRLKAHIQTLGWY